jgi:hypothetical protein
MIRMVGEIGGWVATPGKTEMPGMQTIWIGLQRVHDFAKARKTAATGVRCRNNSVNGTPSINASTDGLLDLIEKELRTRSIFIKGIRHLPWTALTPKSIPTGQVDPKKGEQSIGKNRAGG